MSQFIINYNFLKVIKLLKNKCNLFNFVTVTSNFRYVTTQHCVVYTPIAGPNFKIMQ